MFYIVWKLLPTPTSKYNIRKIENSDQVQWLLPVIPALCEAEAGGLPEGGQEFETSPANMVKPWLY